MSPLEGMADCDYNQKKAKYNQFYYVLKEGKMD